MILQSLVRLAEREGLVDNPHFETKELHWRVAATPRGEFGGLESLLQVPDGGGRVKARPRGLLVLVPRPLPAASITGVAPDAGYLVGNASFVCAVDLSEDQKYVARTGELERRFAEFRRLVEEATNRLQDEGLVAVVSLLRNGEQMAHVRNEVLARSEAKELASNHLIGFRVVGDDAAFVHLRERVMQDWTAHRSRVAADEQPHQCLVTGLVGPAIDKHPPIKKVPGGTPSGVAIVSFNASAFESYGLSRNENAPVSRHAAEAYTAALNRLLDPRFPDPRRPGVLVPEQHVRLSDDTVAVFWTDQPSRVPTVIMPAVGAGDPDALRELGIGLPLDEIYAELGDNDEDERLPSPQPIGLVHEAPWKGIRPEELEEPGAFRLLILSGGQGRATVRSFHTSRVRETVAAIRGWFQDIRLGTLRGRPALYRLLNSLAVRGERKNLPPNLASEVFLAILTARPLPRWVLEAAVRRCRSEPDGVEQNGKVRRGHKVLYERAALIKASLNRSRGTIAQAQGIRFQEVRPTMNDEERNRGYLLGRMFACLERMQELALGEVGASVTDRYFSAACATPQAVFPRLLKTEVHHYRKACDGQRGGTARWLHGQISCLAMWLIGEENTMRPGETLEPFLKRMAGRPVRGFPAFLPLIEQGLFTLGYHQQRAEWFKKRDVEDADQETAL